MLSALSWDDLRQALDLDRELQERWHTSVAHIGGTFVLSADRRGVVVLAWCG
jgi:hypothetical protein